MMQPQGLPVRAVHPELIPPHLAREIRTIVDDVRINLQNDIFPTILIQIYCDYRETPRHFAAIEAGDPTVMFLCPDLADEPPTRIRGILYHEMGHVLQWLERSITGRNELHGRDTEQDADHKVEGVCGIRIYYDEDLVQCAGPGAHGYWPRPRGLR